MSVVYQVSLRRSPVLETAITENTDERFDMWKVKKSGQINISQLVYILPCVCSGEAFRSETFVPTERLHPCFNVRMHGYLPGRSDLVQLSSFQPHNEY